MMKVDPIPKGYHTVTPYLAVRHVPETIEFLQQAFAAEVIDRHALPDGRVMNAAVRIGNSMVMLGEVPPDQTAWPAMLYLYTVDADAMYRQAMTAGAKSVMAMTDQFYGDRSGAVEDPSGNQWWIATRVEDLSGEELIERAKKARG